jgi:hypothetical protein
MRPPTTRRHISQKSVLVAAPLAAALQRHAQSQAHWRAVVDFEEIVSTTLAAAVKRSSGGELYVDAAMVRSVIDLSESRGVRILGLEGLIVSDAATWPSLERIADYSNLKSTRASCEAARNSLSNGFELPWRRLQPGERYMFCFTWAKPSASA